MNDATGSLERKMAEVVDRHGSWTAMNVHLGDGLYTLGRGTRDERLRRLVQLAADATARPLDQLRVLDLACLEGHYALEFAMHGAHAVGIEAREDNVAKAEFARDALGLGDRLELIRGDVRDLGREAHGGFDVVLCAGILYHLDAPDVFGFLERIAEVCDRCAIVDTFVSLRDEAAHEHRGRRYWGRYYQEHSLGATAEEKARDPWASIDNQRSFWLTRSSLYNALSDVGFTSVLECHVPALVGTLGDRITLLALKGEPVRLLSSPPTDAEPNRPWPERYRPSIHPSQDPWVAGRRRVGRLLPGPVRRAVKGVLRSAGLMNLGPGIAPPPDPKKR